MQDGSGEPPSADAGAAPFVWSAEVAAAFPPAFVAFLQQNDIHPDNYNVPSPPRYFQIVRRAGVEAVAARELDEQFGCRCEAVGWLPGYYSLPADVKIARTPAYLAGHIFGIDVASGAAVAALDARPGDHVLDLCCAPGAKLCALAEAVASTGSVTGVDVCEERLAACRTLCEKYRADRARLFLADGCEFSRPPPARRRRSPRSRRPTSNC